MIAYVEISQRAPCSREPFYFVTIIQVYRVEFVTAVDVDANECGIGPCLRAQFQGGKPGVAGRQFGKPIQHFGGNFLDVVVAAGQPCDVFEVLQPLERSHAFAGNVEQSAGKVYVLGARNDFVAFEDTGMQLIEIWFPRCY